MAIIAHILHVSLSRFGFFGGAKIAHKQLFDDDRRDRNSERNAIKGSQCDRIVMTFCSASEREATKFVGSLAAMP